MCRFYPAGSYFNLVQHPVCVTRSTVEEPDIGDCAAIGRSLPFSCIYEPFIGDPDSEVEEHDLNCFGPFCSENPPFTTQVENLPEKMNSTKYGGCSGSSLVDEGCPVLLFYRLKIGNGLSLPSSIPTHKLWVRNTNQNSAEGKILVALSYGRFSNGEEKLISEVTQYRSMTQT